MTTFLTKFKMTSCEKLRSSAYSEDLRWRIVWQKYGLQLNILKIAENLSVDKSTVSRVLHTFCSTGLVSKKAYPVHRARRKITLPIQLFILNLVLDQPGILLREIQSLLLSELQLKVCLSTIYRFLHKAGFTRQKLLLYAAQRSEFLRMKYTSEMSIYNTEMMIFVDETGTDMRDIHRKHGYSLRGKPLKSQVLHIRGERVSAIACMSMNGLLDVQVLHGTTDGETCYDFVQTHLLPHLLPFNGENCHSVVIMDNCSIHHIPEVTQSINAVGSLVEFLPPYSPDFNPIEELFSKVKTILPTVECHNPQLTIETTLLTAFAQITVQDCQKWILHTNIYV